jgi:hypothetical protein
LSWKIHPTSLGRGISPKRKLNLMKSISKYWEGGMNDEKKKYYLLKINTTD